MAPFKKKQTTKQKAPRKMRDVDWGFPEVKPRPRRPGPYTKTEVILQTRFVESKLLLAYSIRRIMNASQAVLGYTLTASRIMKLTARIHEEWAQTSANNRNAAKERQLIRLHESLEIAKRMYPTASMLNAIARFEELIAKIEGTEAPTEVKIDVRHTEAVMMVLGSMDPSEMQDFLDEQKQLEALAAKAKLPELVMDDGKSTFGRTA